MIAPRVGNAPRRPRRPPGDHEAISALVGFDPERSKPGHEHGDAIAFFDAQLSSAADADRDAGGGKRRKGGKLVDQSRHFVRPDRQVTRTIMLDHDKAARLVIGLAWRARHHLDTSPKAPQHAQKRRARRIQADAFNFNAGSRQHGRSHEPEGRRRQIAGNS